MIASITRIRAIRLTALALALTGTAACGDNELPDPEPEIAEVVFSIDGVAAFTVSSAGAVTSGSTAIPVGVHQLRAAAFDEDGNAVDEVADGIFELRGANVNPATLEFTKGNALLTGSLNAKQGGSASVRLELWHLEEDHEDWGPFTVQFIVTPQ